MGIPKLFSRRNCISLIECSSVDDGAISPLAVNRDDNDAPSNVRRLSSEEFDWEVLEDIETMKISSTDWDELTKVLNSKESITTSTAAKDLSDITAVCVEFSNGFILHEAIKLGAPVDILMLIAERFPAALTQQDEDEKYPLHLACASDAASPEFISHCINMCPLSASSKDGTGKTPVHHLCMNNSITANEKKMNDILWMLYRKAPGSFVAEDNDGQDPIECALESDLGIGFIRTLQGMIGHYNENQARKLAHRKVVAARRELKRQNSPHAAYAA